MAEFRHEKGVKHVLDHMGDSLNPVDSGIGERLHDEGIRSYPGGHRRHLAGNPTYPGQKNIIAIWPLSGEGEVFGKGVVGRSRKILQNLTIASEEKVSS